MREAESRGVAYLFKIRRSARVRSLFKSLADGAGRSDYGFGWQAAEVSLRLDGRARGRRVLFIRRPAQKKVEAAEPKRRRGKRTPSPKDGVIVPAVPGRPKQEEFGFVKDFRGRGSTAGQLDEKTRRTIVVRRAFRRILLPDPALKPLYALK